MNRLCLLASFLLLVAVGCSSDATSAVTADEVNTVSLSVPGMSCPAGCAPQVEKTLAGLPGVSDVQVHFESKTATVHADPATFDTQAAIDALAEAGFKDSTLASGK